MGQGSMGQGGMGGKTLLLVWGSADWGAVHRLMDAGRMPHVRRLVERGSLVSLAASEPLTREALLTTLATGMLADRHGVVAPLQVRADGGGVEPVGRRSWAAPALWEVLEAEGVRTATIAWSATAPADRWPGVHVDERFAYPAGGSFEGWPVPPGAVSPGELEDVLAGLRVHPADPLSGALAALAPGLGGGPEREGRLGQLRVMLARVATVHAAVTHVLGGGAWDVVCASYNLLHLVRLAFTGVEGPYAAVLDEAHVFQDMLLGRLVELAGPEATIFLVTPDTLAEREGGRLEVRPRGVLVAAGPGIGGDRMLAGARLADVAPTVLARYGVGVACDGVPIGGLWPGEPLRGVQVGVGVEEVGVDPAEALLAMGYSDALTAAQAEAVRGVEQARMAGLGVALMGRGRLVEAAAVLERALEGAARDVGLLRRLARCRALTGDYAGCLELGRRLLAIDPVLPWGHLVMATWASLGGASGALGADPEPYLVSARELGAGEPEVLVRIGGLELLLGRAEAAREDFAAALALEPDLAEAAYGLGLAQARAGDDAGAERELRRAIRLEYNLPLAHLELGLLLGRQGRWRDAVGALETARAQAPGLGAVDGPLDQARAGLAGLIAGQAVSEGEQVL